VQGQRQRKGQGKDESEENGKRRGVVESKEKGKGAHCQLRKGTGAPSTWQARTRAKGKEKKDKAR
jgi:hypothetical protein